MEDTLVNFGSAIKSLEQTGDLVTVGAHGILWGGADLAGDYFTPGTHFGARKGLGVDTMLHHGIPLSPALKTYADILLPPTVKAEPDEHGILVATVLDLRDSYQRKIYEMCEEGALSWSSGANPRGVRRRDGAKSGEILQWPIMEFSFTPTPCEWRMSGIGTLKALLDAEEYQPEVMERVVKALTDGKVTVPVTIDVRKSEAKADGEKLHKFASTQINLPADIANALMEWGQDNIPDELLAEDGREGQPHVTVLYGLHDDNRVDVQAAAIGMGPIRVSIGHIDIFEADEYDVVFATVHSPDLFRLRGRLERLEHTSTYPEYKPHATIAYVKKGTGKVFKDQWPALDIGGEVTLDTFYLSDRQGQLQAISTHPLSVAKAAEIKAGRVLSKGNHSYLSDLLASLQKTCGELEGMLQEHAPDTNDDDPGKSAPVTVTQGDDALKAVASFLVLEARMKGHLA
jgi:2'-5' RNA ligase